MPVKTIISSLLLTAVCYGAAAQTIPAPVIEAVSVNPLTGEVSLSWDIDASVPVDGFIVLWLNRQTGGTTNYGIDTLHNAAARSHTFQPAALHLSPPLPDPRANSVPFTVAAFRKIPWTPGLRSEEHYNVSLSLDFDSCRSELHLAWHPYKGWDNGLRQYRVVQLSDAAPPTVVAVLQDTAHTISGVDANREYRFFIEAEHHDGRIASSYRKEIFTALTPPPSSIRAAALRHTESDIAEIVFEVAPATPLYNFVLLGTDDPEGTWTPLDTLENTATHITASDNQRRGKTFYYRLAALHPCNDRYTASSDTIAALWLTIEATEQYNALMWEPFTGWPDARYEIYRTTDRTPETLVATLHAGAFNDQLAALPAGEKRCYRVVAVHPATAAQSVSNRVCLLPESDIFIPDAFTPNGDGLNDIYRPHFSYEPQEYAMTIIDRNGSKVFESRSPSAGWNGRLKNNRPAGEGAYGYYIRYQTAKGMIFEKRGMLLLIKTQK
ncbi:MAG: gliding motility-associated C-terminal domain-containing protein [Bacteroidales bacterium]|jgi:gliding motility-associated-like protein|nr:gliding motility-associated C-terminal domain-containing protein [Bacteroidales bacterium]